MYHLEKISCRVARATLRPCVQISRREYRRCTKRPVHGYDLDTNLAQRPTTYTGLRRKYYARISSFTPVISSCRSSPPLPSGVLRISSPYRPANFLPTPRQILYPCFFFLLYIYLKYFFFLSLVLSLIVF